MAKRSSLSIRIVEGKNLPAKDITGSSDPYCIVKVDNEPIIRTATVWKTLCPFWGEEYQVHLPPTFHSVAFYVMDEDALSRDDVIGKVCLTRDTLAAHPKGFSGWAHLTEVDPDEEVQGEIHLRLEVVSGTGTRRLRCSVLEARDLAPKDRNGASDPFVRVHYNGRTQETSIVKKSCYPRWNETFEFELEEGATEALCVEAWDWDLVSRNDFLGKVVFNVPGLWAAQQEEGWFRLQPDKSKSQLEGREGWSGMKVTQFQVSFSPYLPGQDPSPSQAGSPHLSLPTALDLALFSELQGNMGLLLSALWQFLEQSLRPFPFKDFLADPRVLSPYARKPLASLPPFLTSPKVCPQTPNDDSALLLSPCGRLGYGQKGACPAPRQFHRMGRGCLLMGHLLWATVCKVARCPACLSLSSPGRVKCTHGRDDGDHGKNVPFIAVTSFLCLRFLSPAIMAPKLFYLREQHADARTSRTLLLLAKAVQNVGNMDTPASRAKEAWMEPLQSTVHQGVAQLKDFITKLVNIEEKEGECHPQPAVAPPVKEGPLFIHRTKGKGPLMSSSFKKLHFSLTTEALSFAKTPSSKKSSLIKLANIRAAEKVEEKSFGSSRVMQIIYTDDVGRPQTAYLQCKCMNELNQWLSALRKVSMNNTGLLGSYHPGVFRGDRWSCCHQKDKTDVGCDKTRSRVTLQEWNDPLDHDLEAQLIYRYLL
uniref:RAS p21 protein activator 4 n=1 Tax=Loxodonta africana TaxID=9785 RepID=G3U8E3_LOXAF